MWDITEMVRQYLFLKSRPGVLDGLAAASKNAVVKGDLTALHSGGGLDIAHPSLSAEAVSW